MIKSYRRSIAFWLLAVLPLQLSVGEQPATRPNIVFIIVDDLGYRNLGCYGGKSIQTPNIDAMCKEGMRFHAHDYYTSHLFRNSGRVDLNGPSHDVISNGERTGRKGRYSHYAIHDETLKFIKESAASGKPFFCYAPWTPPHADLVIPEDDPAWDLYKDKEVWPGRAKVVAAMISMVDRHVGELLGLLKELEIDDNTIVFFTSDNGASRHWPGIHDSCGELKGIKGSSYEGGFRVPMVVRWPGKIKAGTVSDLPWYFPDVMPTLAELAGVSLEVPRDTDGISIVPTLLGKDDQQRHEFLLWSGAIRMGNWKGVGKPGKLSLYDLSKNIAEKNDLAGKQPEIVTKLSDLMQKAWSEPRSQQADVTYTGREEHH
jgi:arylsulfatase A-like enzyme